MWVSEWKGLPWNPKSDHEKYLCEFVKPWCSCKVYIFSMYIQPDRFCQIANPIKYHKKRDVVITFVYLRKLSRIWGKFCSTALVLNNTLNKKSLQEKLSQFGGKLLKQT